MEEQTIRAPAKANILPCATGSFLRHAVATGGFAPASPCLPASAGEPTGRRQAGSETKWRWEAHRHGNAEMSLWHMADSRRRRTRRPHYHLHNDNTFGPDFPTIAKCEQIHSRAQIANRKGKAMVSGLHILFAYPPDKISTEIGNTDVNIS